VAKGERRRESGERSEPTRPRSRSCARRRSPNLLCSALLCSAPALLLWSPCSFPFREAVCAKPLFRRRFMSCVAPLSPRERAFPWLVVGPSVVGPSGVMIRPARIAGGRTVPALGRHVGWRIHAAELARPAFERSFTFPRPPVVPTPQYAQSGCPASAYGTGESNASCPVGRRRLWDRR